MILPKTKLSGLKICPNGPDRTESIVPGSKSTKTALGTYFPPKKKTWNSYQFSNGYYGGQSVGRVTKQNKIPLYFHTCSFIVINVDSFQLKIGITVVCASWIDAMFVGDNFPELQ